MVRVGGYYRLAEKDNVGKFYLSNLIKSDCLVSARIIAYPIPANNIVNVDIKCTYNGKTDIWITDVYGKNVVRITKNLQKGINHEIVYLGNRANGQYFIKVIGQDNLKPIKIVIH